MIDSMIRGSITRPRFIVTLLSCSLILVPPGAVTYGFNSITDYLLSYIRSTSDESVSKSAFAWIYSALMVGQAMSMIIGGILEKRYPTRIIAFVSATLFNLNIFLMYLSCSDVISLAASYFIAGFTLGLIYVTSLIVGLSWIGTEYHGMAAGIISLCYGLSSIAASPLATLYVNPNNIVPLQDNTTGEYVFSDEGILENIPNMFLIFGVVSMVIQLPLSVLLVKNPDLGDDKQDSSDSIKVVKDLLSTPNFYVLFMIFGLNKVPLAYIGANVKFYGETFIKNDRILGVIVGLAGLFNALGRPFWGRVFDKLGLKPSLLLLSVCIGLTILVSYLSRFVEGAAVCSGLYAVSVWGAFFSCTGVYGIMPAATIQLFGQDLLGVKYGVLYLSQGLGAVVSALYTCWIPFWFPLVITIVFTSLVSGVLALVLRVRVEKVERDSQGLLSSEVSEEGFELHALRDGG